MEDFSFMRQPDIVNGTNIRIIMQNAKPLSFSASALDYFTFSIIAIITAYIPFFGWAFLLNYSGQWFSDRTLVNGQKISYKAGYGESLKFIFVNTLLIIITLGIYSFWFYPKMYSYIVDHISYGVADSDQNLQHRN